MEHDVKIACCVFTHNHAETMKDILDRAFPVYCHFGIDIYIYDDSTDQLTEDIVLEYIERQSGHIFYIDAHMTSGAEEKTLYALKGYGFEKEYDYIWIAKDRVCFSENYLRRLLCVLERKADVIMGMDVNNRWSVDRQCNCLSYEDPVKFYRDFGFYTTNYEMLCVRVEPLVSGTDWDKYEKEYHVDSTNPFNRYVWLFERFTEIKDITIEICPYESGDMYISPYSNSGWWSDLFPLWIDKWVSVNYTLPEIYAPYKMEVIKALTNRIDKFGSVEQMMNYHEQGIFTSGVFEKYKSMWQFITEIPIEWLRLIAEDDYETVFRLAIGDFEKSIRERNYSRAYWLLFSNQWFSKVYSEQKYYALLSALYCFYDQMINTGHSEAFEGLESIDDIVAKYG